nr:STN domain-containing protein [Candidatus Hydrogenedentota bacterium]
EPLLTLTHEKATSYLRIVESSIRIDFRDMDLCTMLSVLADAYDVNIVVDSRVVMPEDAWAAMQTDAGGSETAEPPPPFDVARNTTASAMPPTGMVSYVSLKNVAFRDALKALLRPLNLTYSVEFGYVRVSSVES